MSGTRIEKDTFGPIEVPDARLWGAQTQRSLEHFRISGERMPAEIVEALAWVKRACAAVNESLDATPELVNTDPYGEGWMYELRPSDAAAVDALLDPAAYQALLS